MGGRQRDCGFPASRAALEVAPLASTDVASVVAIENAASAQPRQQAAVSEEVRCRDGCSFVVRLRAGPRLGIGTLLLQHGLEGARRRGACTAFPEVRRNNRAARALYVANGFDRVGKPINYYAHDGQDALIMHRTLEETT